METLLIICIIILLWKLYECMKTKEFFKGKPDHLEIDNRVNQILQNRDAFNDNLYTAREKMPWLDAIVYEDVRHKLRNGSFNHHELKKVYG